MKDTITLFVSGKTFKGHEYKLEYVFDENNMDIDNIIEAFREVLHLIGFGDKFISERIPDVE